MRGEMGEVGKALVEEMRRRMMRWWRTAAHILLTGSKWTGDVNQARDVDAAVRADGSHLKMFTLFYLPLTNT